MEPDRVATVGQLRAALEGIPDDTPLIVNAADPDNPGTAAGQVITSTGFGRAGSGDGYGPEPGSLFALNCHMGGLDPGREPVRPARQPEAAARPVTEPVPGPEPECGTCGAVTGLEKVTWRSPSGARGARGAEWFCTDRSACTDRRFPGLAELLGKPGAAGAEVPEPHSEAERLAGNDADHEAEP